MQYPELNKLRQQVTCFVNDGVCDSRLLDALAPQGVFLPKECELWDYKQQAPHEGVEISKTVLQVISLYNTFGGYLIFGLKEISDAEYNPIGIAKGQFDLTRLKQFIKNYTRQNIDITWVELGFNCQNNSAVTIGVLHVPKRRVDAIPVGFAKNGPDHTPGNPIFRASEIYFRLDHECIPVRDIEDYRFLSGIRSNRTLQEMSSGLRYSTEYPSITYHNLPDKNAICAHFVGRGEIRRQLWQWLNDDVSYAKVLAGDGGKGKTSIAYKFCQEVCETPPLGFEQVLWLSAKEQAFSGYANKWIQLDDAQFSDLNSLLQAICKALPFNEDEIAGNSNSALKSMLKDALVHFPCLIVIDNLDSMNNDEQKKILETAVQIGNPRAKLLLTTRINQAFSSDLMIVVPGLESNDYRDYVTGLCTRLNLPHMKGGDIDSLQARTEGSPLLTESIFRLRRLGMPLQQALREWAGKSGSDARAAAIKKEIGSLSLEAKRVLLAATYFADSSFTELRLATGYGTAELTEHIEELSSLFLLSSPKVTEGENRFTVSRNTSLVILEIKDQLVADHKALDTKVHNIRRDETGVVAPSIRNTVGKAITQANAFLRAGNTREALETINSELRRLPENSDLLLSKGICLLSNTPPDYTQARACFSNAHQHGGRKALLFEKWFTAEHAVKHPPGMIDVATLALGEVDDSSGEWFYKRALGKTMQGQVWLRSGERANAIHEFESAADDLTQEIRRIRSPSKLRLIEDARALHEYIWSVSTEGSTSLNAEELFYLAKRFINRNDYRAINYFRMRDSCQKYIAALKAKHTTSRMYESAKTMIYDLRILQEQRNGYAGSDHENAKTFNASIKALENELTSKRPLGQN